MIRHSEHLFFFRVRAQLIEELPNYFKLRLGICPAGDRALDLLTEVGASRIAETMIRFVSNVKLSPRDNWAVLQ